MNYERFKIYAREHRANIKHISSKTFLKSKLYKDGAAKFSPCVKKINFYFNKIGQLTMFSKIKFDDNSKITRQSIFFCAYLNLKLPLIITEIDPVLYALKKEYRFKYNSARKIIKEEQFHCPKYHTELKKFIEINHVYYQNTHLINTSYLAIESSSYDTKETLGPSKNVLEFSIINSYQREIISYKNSYDTDNLLKSSVEKNNNSLTTYNYNNTELIQWKRYVVNSGNEWEGIRTLNEKGHWIKEVVKKNGAMQRVVLRDIEYYE